MDVITDIIALITVPHQSQKSLLWKTGAILLNFLGKMVKFVQWGDHVRLYILTVVQTGGSSVMVEGNGVYS